MVYSIEYAHYDGSVPLAEIINFTNHNVSNILKLYPDAQKCIMFDDIHAGMSFDEFQKELSSLNVPPDTIYAESAFEYYAQMMLKQLVEQGFVEEEQNGCSYITKKDKQYNQESKFLLRYEKRQAYQFSCPALVAASYLYRLGYFQELDTISALGGKPVYVQETGSILSVLPSQYIQVEANAHVICELLSPGITKRIQYFLY